LPIFYHHSLSLSDLAIELEAKIHSEQKKSPLRPPLIVIPNLNIERWLKINLPRLAPSKISMNLRYVFLEKILEELILKNPSSPVHKKTIFTHSEMESKIFQYLTEKKDLLELQFLKDFLSSSSRRYYLSSQLATYFKDYELNRSSWIYEWGKAKNIEFPNFSQSKFKKQKPEDSYLIFQRKIYSDLFLEPSRTKITFGQGLIESMAETLKTEELSLHLFCLANLSNTYIHFLHHLTLAGTVTINFYQFHTGESNQKKLKDKTSPFRWSYPQVSLASTLSNFPEIQKNATTNINNLITLPLGLLELRKYLLGEKRDQKLKYLKSNSGTEDGSLRVWNAPSEYRELEAVANDILYKMNRAVKNAEDLSLLDFSILLTDIKSYRSAIEWIFEGGILIESEESGNQKIIRQKIPYSLVDLKASDASPLYRTFCDFWNLCREDGFSFSDLQKMIRNPLVNLFLRENELVSDEMELLFSQLRVAYQEFHSNNKEDPFQISNGIDRAVLSSIFSQKTSESKNMFPSIQIEDESTIAKITVIWEKIIATRNKVITFLQDKSWNKESFATLRLTFENLFQLEEDDFENRKQFNLFWEQFSVWEDMILPEKEGLELIQVITEQAFAGISIKKGDYLTGGVTISLLQPMRPLPFKHVYILGLGEGKFPGNSDTSSLNLRLKYPEEWDLDRRQIQESLFWESLFSGTSSITLSYVGKNTKEDKIFEPCSSLNEIMQGMGIETALEIPLVTYSKSYDHSEDSIKAGLLSFDYSLAWVLDKKIKPHILTEFQDPSLLPSSTKKIVSKEKIFIKELAQFIKDPLDTFLKKKLGMYEEAESEDSNEEFFSLNDVNRSNFIRNIYKIIFKNLGKKNQNWNRAYFEDIISPILEIEKKKANLPQGVYGIIEKENILNHFIDRIHLFEKWSHELEGANYYPFLSFGDTGLGKEICLKLPSLQFDDNTNVILFHECEHVFEKNGQFFHIYTKRLEDSLSTNNEYLSFSDYFGNLISPFLTWLSFAMSDKPLKIYTTNLKTKDKVFLESLNFQIEDPQTKAKFYLNKVVDAYNREEPSFFPRIVFLNFCCELLKNPKGNSLDITSIPNVEDLWLEYQSENIEMIFYNLSSLTKLYPNTSEYLFKPNIDFAKDFYFPMGLWRV